MSFVCAVECARGPPSIPWVSQVCCEQQHNINTQLLMSPKQFLSGRPFFMLLSLPGFCHCCMILRKSLTSAWTSWSICNMVLAILKTFLRSLTFMEDKCNRQAVDYSAVVLGFLISGWCIYELCYCSWLSPLPLISGIGTVVQPLESSWGWQSCICCQGVLIWRITMVFGGSVARTHHSLSFLLTCQMHEFNHRAHFFPCILQISVSRSGYVS